MRPVHSVRVCNCDGRTCQVPSMTSFRSKCHVNAWFEMLLITLLAEFVLSSFYLDATVEQTDKIHTKLAHTNFYITNVPTSYVRTLYDFPLVHWHVCTYNITCNEQYTDMLSPTITTLCTYMIHVYKLAIQCPLYVVVNPAIFVPNLKLIERYPN